MGPHYVFRRKILWIFLFFGFCVLAASQDDAEGTKSLSSSYEPSTDEERFPCVFRSELIPHRKKWNIDACTSCVCSNGTANCRIISCILSCSNAEAVVIPGECCAVCPPKMLVTNVINLAAAGTPISERSVKDMAFDFEVEVSRKETARTVKGDKLWKLNTWVSSNQDGSGRKFSYQENIMNKKQRKQTFYKPDTPPFMFTKLNYQFASEQGTCDDYKFFCIKFNLADEPEINYGVHFTFNVLDNDESHLVSCVPLGKCTGLTLRTFDWTVEAENLAPGMVTPIVLNVDISFRKGDPDLSGEGLWRVGAFGSGSSFGVGQRYFEVSQTLTEAQMATSVINSQLSFSGVNSEMEIGSIGCSEDVLYLCVEFTKGLMPDPEFAISYGNKKTSEISCKLRECAGRAVFTDLEASRQSPEIFVEGTSNQASSFVINAITDKSSSNKIEGSSLWSVSTFFSKSALGEGFRIDFQNQILNPPQADTTLENMADLEFGAVNFNVDLSGQICSEVPYICFQLAKNPASSLGYIFETDVPGKTFVQTCVSISDHCKGVVFTDLSWSRTVQPHPAGDEAGLFIDATIGTTLLSPAVAGYRLWDVSLFTSASEDGSDPQYLDESFMHILTTDEEAKNLQRGGPLKFTNLRTAKFDTNTLGCRDRKYLCLKFQKGSSPSPDYTVEFAIEIGTFSGEGDSFTTFAVDSITKCLQETCPAGSLFTS